MFGDSDLPVFFADFGKPTPVMWKGQGPVNGIFDEHTDVFRKSGPGGVERVVYRLTIPYNVFSAPGPQPRDVITVAGVTYTVSELPECHDLQTVDLLLKLTS